MEESNIFQVALVCGLIGLCILLIFAEKVDMSYSDINNISNLSSEVKVKGYVKRVTNLPELLIFDIEDLTGSITVVAFKEGNISIQRNDIVEVFGDIEIYNNKLEILAKQVKLF